MGLLSWLFGDSDSKRGKPSTGGIIDLRKNPSDSGEVILNFWYVKRGPLVTSLRAKPYVASGTDEEMVALLRQRAESDYHDATEHPVPKGMESSLRRGAPGDLAPLLFQDVIASTESHGFRYNPESVMFCCTCLVQHDDGTLSVQIDREETYL